MMHTCSTSAAYHEPTQLDSNLTNPTQPNPTNRGKGPCPLMIVSMAITTVDTLQRLHNFTHRLVISSLAKQLKVFNLPNVHFLCCTTRRSPHSFSQRFPARKIFTLRFHHCGSHFLRRPPLVARLGDKSTPSSKSRKSHPVLLHRLSAKLGKQHSTQLSLPISAM
jgi:hypothetical protein